MLSTVGAACWSIAARSESRLNIQQQAYVSHMFMSWAGMGQHGRGGTACPAAHLRYVNGWMNANSHVFAPAPMPCALDMCVQGVSRSATVVIAYLMWKTGGTYDGVFARVKVRHGASPHMLQPPHATCCMAQHAGLGCHCWHSVRQSCSNMHQETGSYWAHAPNQQHCVHPSPHSLAQPGLFSMQAIRGIANPNIGFTCQLLQWQKRRNAPPARTRMYRISPHCAHAPLLLVPRTVRARVGVCGEGGGGAGAQVLGERGGVGGRTMLLSQVAWQAWVQGVGREGVGSG